MSASARCVVLRAYAQALKAEQDGLNVGFCWSPRISLIAARRSVDDRMRLLRQRADECGVDLWCSPDQPAWVAALRAARNLCAEAA
jgi:hypothetical protein